MRVTSEMAAYATSGGAAMSREISSLFVMVEFTTGTRWAASRGDRDCSWPGIWADSLGGLVAQLAHTGGPLRSGRPVLPVSRRMIRRVGNPTGPSPIRKT